jgi:hypothetical protein
MNGAFCKGAEKAGGSPQVPIASLCCKKEQIRSPERRATLMQGKNYAYILTLAFGLHFSSALSNSIAVRLACWRGMFRLRTCVLFNMRGSLIDDGVNFMPPG